ncbi:MAG: transglycosylase SLT domain-containing protein, partial [Pseudomonadales bacterium]|nr:transglycosylase SLT domain-containing protein [Pseudomonadales bacterium]
MFPERITHRLPSRLPSAGFLLCAWTVLCLTAAAAPVAQASSRYEERTAYKAALDHLTAGRMDDFRKSRTELSDYPLAPYLDYYALQSRLSTASAASVVDFRTTHADLPVADILFNRWLKRLATQRKWQTFIDHFEAGSDAELRCYHLRALLATDQKATAYSQVPYLWISAHSQPKACDPLFESWIAGGNLTEAMVWERLTLAIDANNRTLARYLLRFFESPIAKVAESYYAVHNNPATITSAQRFRTDNAQSRQVIAHGLIRLSASAPEDAAKAWLGYQDSHAFTADLSERIETALLTGHARMKQFPEHPELIPEPRRRAAAPEMAKAAVTQAQWQAALYWIEQLDAEVRAERIWQYWLARALDAGEARSERARETFAALAGRRDYYGFLAAERIGVPVELNNHSTTVKAQDIGRLQERVAVQRATELYAVGDIINARREWFRLLPQLDIFERATAATLVAELGWTTQAIAAANSGGLHDAVNLRFPVVYEQEFERISHITTVPQAFLLAVARQESAFDPTARSHANARGLMQLMQPTAEQVARRIGVSAPSASDLYRPGLNIELGGHHLAALMDRYGNRRPLVAAAYNAGEHRVQRWIRDASGTEMDVWIETIPFRETR